MHDALDATPDKKKDILYFLCCKNVLDELMRKVDGGSRKVAALGELCGSLLSF
jgi:hypothetical protein